jgi:hypothetical protein
MLGSKHSYTHTAALLRLIIGRILLFVCADEREINSNAGSARAPFLWLIWFDLLITFVSFVFPRNFSSVGKRDQVTRWEKTVCLSRVGKFEQRGEQEPRRPMAHLERWRTLVSSFSPIHAAPINMQTRGIGRLLFSFFPSFSSYCLCFARLDRWLPSGLFCMSNQVESAAIDTTELVTMHQTVSYVPYGLYCSKSHSFARLWYDDESVQRIPHLSTEKKEEPITNNKTANRINGVGAGLLCDGGERSWILKYGMSEKTNKQTIKVGGGDSCLA